MALDNLSIEIQGNASKATIAIDSLITKLSALSGALSSLSSIGNLGNLAQGVNQLSQSMANFKASNVNKADFTRLADSINTLAGVNTGNLATVSSSLTTLGTSLNSIQLNNGQTIGAITSLSNSLAKLGSVNTAQFNANIPITTNAIRAIVNELNTLGNVNYNVAPLTAFINAISRLGGNNIGNAPANIQRVTQALMQMMQTLQNAPAISDSVVRMTEAMSRMGGRTTSMMNTSSRSTSSFISRLRSLGNVLGHTTKKTTSLASAFGKFYASYFMVLRGINLVKKAVLSSASITEAYNYFFKSYRKVAQDSDDFKKLGEKDADEYVKGYVQEATKLTTKMSGYEVSYTGQLTLKNQKFLGLNPVDVMTYQAQYTQMANSMGVSAEYSSKISDSLTKIGGDLASLRNMNYKDVWNNMSSGLVGMSRAMDKYGVNIRITALNQELLDMGINTTVAKLSAEDKALLRTTVILKNSKQAWGDLADTIDRPANAMRVTKIALENLGRTLGGIVMAGVMKVLPYIQGLIIALQRLAQWLVAVLGIKLPEVTSEGGNDMSDLVDEIEDADDALGDAGKSADKLKKQLLDIDELNVINEKDSGASSSSSSMYDGDEIKKAFDEIYRQYDEAWKKAFENMDNKAQEIADNIAKMFKKGDYFAIGRYVSDGVAKALKSINWDSVFSKARKAGKASADFLNGLFSPEDFEVFGSTLANWINTKLYFVSEFVQNFDWGNAGRSIGNAFNGFFRDIDAVELGKTISNTLIGALDLAIGFFDATNFKKIGEKFADVLENIDWDTLLQKTCELIVKAFIAGIDFNSALAESDNILLNLFAGANPVFGNVFTRLKAISSIIRNIGNDAQKTAEQIHEMDVAELVANPTDQDKQAQATEKKIKEPLTIEGSVVYYETKDGQPVLLVNGEKADPHEYAQKCFDYLFNNVNPQIKVNSIDIVTEGAKIGESEKKTQEAINATQNAYKQYAEEQRNLAEQRKSNISENYDVAQSFKDLGISADELSKYISTLSNVDIKSLSKNVTDMKTVISGQFPQVVAQFKEGLGDIKTEFINLNNYLENNFFNLFTEEKTMSKIGGMQTAFETVFKNIGRSIQVVFNRIIDGINKALHIEWQELKIGDTVVLEAGEMQIATLPKIKGFELGGFPDKGLFMMNEGRSAEMVGSINGRTAVVNNDQIVQAVSQGVANAVSSVMANNNTNVNVVLEGDAKGIFRQVRNEARIFNRQTGTNALVF